MWRKRGTKKGGGVRRRGDRVGRGTARALPSQERQQGPWRGWVQGVGGQGSRWQDTKPSRQRQWRQGSSGGEKCSWWRAGTKAPGRGQPEGEAAGESLHQRGWGQAVEGIHPGEVARGAAPTWALWAALSRQQDRLWAGQGRAAARQALHIASLQMDQARAS